MAVEISNKVVPLDRMPPQSIESEQAVLGAMLLDPTSIAKVMGILDAESFYRESHKKLFDTILALFDKHEPVDPVTLVEALKSKSSLEAVGGAGYVAELFEVVPTAANVEHYAHIVREKALVRSLISSCTKIVSRSYDVSEDPETLLNDAEQEIFRLAERKISEPVTRVDEVAKLCMGNLEEARKAAARGELQGVPTGFTDLDKLLAGLHRSELIVIAGRPSMGKTALAMDIARYVGLKIGLPVVIFSLEMSKEELVKRLLCAEGGVDLQRFRTGRVELAEWGRLMNAASNYYEKPIFIDDSPAISVMEMTAKVRRIRAHRGVGLVIVDYLQLMQSRRRADNRQQEISEISRSFKAMARELDLPVIVLSQLNREVESRNPPVPHISDLRESGAIEQDADVILLLMRMSVYQPTEQPGDIAQIIVGKQRNGPTGQVELAFLKQYTRFENLERYQESAA